MKKDSRDRIEQIFREGLSDHTSIVSADLDVPQGVWMNIENELNGSKSKKGGGFLGFMLALMGVGLLMGYSFYSMAQMTNFEALDFLDVPDSIVPAQISTTAAMTDALLTSKLATVDEVIRTDNQADENRDPGWVSRGVSSSKVAIVGAVNQDQRTEVIKNANSLYALGREKDEDTHFQNTENATDIELEDVPESRTIGPLISVPTKLIPLAKSIDLVEGLEGEVKSSTYWTAQLGIGMRSNDYFIQGNFSIDPNTQFNVEKRWSPAIFLSASYFMGKSFSLDAGLHFSPIRTTAKYAFTIPYSAAEEDIIGNIAFRSISHNIPSVDGGLAAETRLERKVEAVVQDGEEIILNADVNQKQTIISLPITARLRILNTGNLHVSAGLGTNFNLQISKLKSDVASLSSSREEIDYRELLLTPIDTKAAKTFFMGYQFGIDAQYYIDNSGTFISAGLTYTNALSPIFSFDNVNVYPRSWGLGVGVGKKF